LIDVLRQEQLMKLIVIIIQPNKLDYVTSALRRAGIAGATVTSARGFGEENVVSDWDLSGELTEKVKLEVVLGNERCDEIVSLVEKTIGSGKPGAGFIYVQEVLASYGYRHFTDQDPA
jgi:nitrogen regulatory protein P-II 1